MLKNIELSSSSLLFFLLCTGENLIRRYTGNREITQNLQSFLSGNMVSFLKTPLPKDFIQSDMEKNFPKEIREKIFILLELFRRMSSNLSNTENFGSPRSKKTYQEIIKISQMRQEEDLFQIVLLNKYNESIWCKDIYKNEPNIFEIFTKVFKLNTKNIVLIQKANKKQNIIQKKNIQFARKIQEACTLLGICFLDYILITPTDGNKSLKKIGLF